MFLRQFNNKVNKLTRIFLIIFIISFYYIIAAEGIRKTGDEVTANKSMESSGLAYDYAVKLSNQKIDRSKNKVGF